MNPSKQAEAPKDPFPRITFGASVLDATQPRAEASGLSARCGTAYPQLRERLRQPSRVLSTSESLATVASIGGQPDRWLTSSLTRFGLRMSASAPPSALPPTPLSKGCSATLSPPCRGACPYCKGSVGEPSTRSSRDAAAEAIEA